MPLTPALKAFLSEQRLLVIAPHADDEVAGAAGLMHRVKQSGGSVFVVILSIGDLKHYDNTADVTKGHTRREELGEAMDYLKVDDYEILIQDDDLHLRLDSIPRRDLVNLIEKGGRLSTDKIRPTMIVLPAPSFNQDHEAVYKAGLTACRPHLSSMKSFQRTVLVADAPQLTWSSVPFKPNFYVDLSDCLDVKLEAYRKHKSQLRPPPHQGGVDALELLARTRGREISVDAAEAFECYRMVL